MPSYIEKHLSFGVDEFEGLWKVEFLHPFFFGNEKQYLTVYVVPPNSDYTQGEYKGFEVVKMGPNMEEVIKQLLPRIEKYPYRWELEGKKLDQFGYDLVCDMAKGSTRVGKIDFTDIAFQEVSRYYSFTDPLPRPDIVTEYEVVERYGGMVKVSVTLEKAQWVNHLSFDFFSEYPIEVASIMYQEDTMKYAPVYEINLGDVTTSSESLSFGFPSVFAKKFTFIFVQSTYTISNTSLSRADQKTKDLWESMQYNVESYLSKLEEEQWAQDIQDYTRSEIERKAMTDTGSAGNVQEWRPEFYQTLAEGQERMEEYNEKLRKYQEAESKYKREMEEYSRYQNELADWYRKWGK